MMNEGINKGGFSSTWRAGKADDARRTGMAPQRTKKSPSLQTAILGNGERTSERKLTAIANLLGKLFDPRCGFNVHLRHHLRMPKAQFASQTGDNLTVGCPDEG